MANENLELDHQYDYHTKLKSGFKDHKMDDIEQGLNQAYKLFVENLLENKHDNLVILGRNLDDAYFPHRLKDISPTNKEISYLGQLRALVNLCDYVSRLRIPQQVWKNIRQSKYVEPILQALLTNGSLLAIELCKSIELPHPSQLSRLVRPLIKEGVIIVEDIGRYNWYSLTATGRLIASERAVSEILIEPNKIVNEIILQLKEGWKSKIDLTEQINVIMPISIRNSIVDVVLITLKEAGMAEEKDGRWRISIESIVSDRNSFSLRSHIKYIHAEQVFEEICPILKTSYPENDSGKEEFFRSWHHNNIISIERKSEEAIEEKSKNKMVMRNPKWPIKI